MEQSFVKVKHWKDLGFVDKVYYIIYLSLYPLTHIYRNITTFNLLKMFFHIQSFCLFYNSEGKVGGISVLFYHKDLDIYNLWGYYKRDCSVFNHRYLRVKDDYKQSLKCFDYVLNELYKDLNLFVFIHPRDIKCLYYCVKKGFKIKGQTKDNTIVLRRFR